jgi:hypothetical protein
MVENVSFQKNNPSRTGNALELNKKQELPKFARSSAPLAESRTAEGSNDSPSGKVDGSFSPYRRLGGQSPEMEAANRQLLNHAAGQMAGLLRSTGKNYQEFQHNGQPAILMTNSGSNDVYLSFNNSHRPTSFLNRLLHPAKPFQFQINTATNVIKQINGPQVLSPMETVAALEGVKFSFQAGI